MRAGISELPVRERTIWPLIHQHPGAISAVFTDSRIDDNQDSVNNQAGRIGFEIESQPCKISVRDIWLRRFD
jgi:hypothetical protein